LKDGMDPLILNKWLNGEASEEDLKNWLRELYPDHLHNDIMAALDESAPSLESDEEIDDILDTMSLSPEEKRQDPEDVNDEKIRKPS